MELNKLVVREMDLWAQKVCSCVLSCRTIFVSYRHWLTFYDVYCIMVDWLYVSLSQKAKC